MKSNQFNEQLTNIVSVKETIRHISSNVDDKKICSFIDESQRLDIKNALGDSLYIELMRYINSNEKNEYYDDLLQGGIYEDKCGNEHEFVGLVKALNYFVYARIVKHADGVVTRFGFVNKNDSNSIRPEFKEKLEEYRDAFAIAELYMNECLGFIRANCNHFPSWKNHSIIPRRGPIITKIGK